MDWPEETILKMIEVYKTKGLLWNPKDRNYSKKSLRDEAWQEISNEINVPEEECKRKMNSLLASYRREKSKIKKSKETEKRKEKIYKSRWFGYEAFRFLEERDVSNEEHTTETLDTMGEVEAEDESEAELILPIEQHVIGRKRESTSSSSIYSTLKQAKRVRRERDNSIVFNNALDVLKTAANKSDKEPPERNEIDAFFTYVAAKVNKYTPETQKWVQHAIFKILIKADSGMFDWRNQYHYNEQNEAHPATSFAPQSPYDVSDNSSDNLKDCI